MQKGLRAIGPMWEKCKQMYLGLICINTFSLFLGVHNVSPKIMKNS